MPTSGDARTGGEVDRGRVGWGGEAPPQPAALQLDALDDAGEVDQPHVERVEDLG